MKRTAILLAAAALLLSGCASHSLERRQALLAPLVGQSEADLVRQVGVPSRTLETDGHRFLAYTERRAEVIPAASGFVGAPFPFRGFGGFDDFEGTSFPPALIQHVCETTFEIVAGRVAGFSLRGDDC